MRYRIIIFFSLLITSFVGCERDRDLCDNNPGCIPPTAIDFEFNFLLSNEQNEVIQLQNDDIADMKLETQGVEEDLKLDPQTNQVINTYLMGLNLGFEPQTANYMLTTPFGEPQFLEIVISSIWADDCRWCREYFISQVIQNEQDTIFDGKLFNETISIRIE